MGEEARTRKTSADRKALEEENKITGSSQRSAQVFGTADVNADRCSLRNSTFIFGLFSPLSHRLVAADLFSGAAQSRCRRRAKRGRGDCRVEERSGLDLKSLGGSAKISHRGFGELSGDSAPMSIAAAHDGRSSSCAISFHGMAGI